MDELCKDCIYYVERESSEPYTFCNDPTKVIMMPYNQGPFHGPTETLPLNKCSNWRDVPK